jgi:hypothetical protein
VPQSDSRPAVVRLRNRDYVAVFTPSFKVLGQKLAIPEGKRPESPASAGTPPPEPAAAAHRKTVDTLIQLLIKKGVLTEEEWRKANKP